MKMLKMKECTTLEVVGMQEMLVISQNSSCPQFYCLNDILEMENVTNRLSSNSIQVNYQYNNGNQQEDEHFEDAD